ncbi:MAG: hypothetical protein JXQ29_07805 [Planctomycetes bacterium]|nr:hypothetical protein [Planctomycetota bacterium]
MKRWTGIAGRGLLLAVLCSGWPARAGDDPADEAAAKGRRILEAALERRGGRAALEGIRDFELTMTGTGKSAAAETAEIHAVRKVLLGKTRCLSDRVRITFPGAGQELLQQLVLRGKEGSLRTRLGGRRLSSDEVQGRWAGFHRSSVGILRALLDEETTIEAAGAGEVNGKATEVVRVHRPGEPPLAVDVDPESGCFLRVRWRERPRSGAPPAPHEIRYRDHRPFGSLKGEPFSAEERVDGAVVTTRRTEAVRINLGLKPSDFELE